MTHLESLIGYFDLDPNRVADLVLEAFEAEITNSGEWGKRDGERVVDGDRDPLGL